MSVGASRWIEDIGFIAAVLIGVVYGLAEAAARVGFCKGACPLDASFPWGLCVIIGALVLPKTLGRATAGRIWSGIINRGSSGRPPATDGEG